MELIPASKETLLLYDSCFALFWTSCSHHHLSSDCNVRSCPYCSLSSRDYNEQLVKVGPYVLILVHSFSMTIGTLNIKRFLALSYRFFHQGSVTKGRLSFFQAYVLFFLVVQLLLANIQVTVNLAFLISLFVFLNY